MSKNPYQNSQLGKTMREVRQKISSLTLNAFLYLENKISRKSYNDVLSYKCKKTLHCTIDRSLNSAFKLLPSPLITYYYLLQTTPNRYLFPFHHLLQFKTDLLIPSHLFPFIFKISYFFKLSLLLI